MNILEINKLTKKIGDKEIIKNVDMTIKEGEIYAFLGANGAGKTTLMKLIFRILRPTSGSVKVLDSEINDTCNPVFNQIGSIIETPVFYENLSAKKNLELHCRYMGEQYLLNINEVLEMVDLTENKIEGKIVREFSLGMKQRLAIARAIISKPKLLILDEPINGLDPVGILEVRKLLKRVNEEYQSSILISSHIISEIDKIANRIGIIDGGMMLVEKNIKEIHENSETIESYFMTILQERGNQYA